MQWLSPAHVYRLLQSALVLTGHGHRIGAMQSHRFLVLLTHEVEQTIVTLSYVENIEKLCQLGVEVVRLWN